VTRSERVSWLAWDGMEGREARLAGRQADRQIDTGVKRHEARQTDTGRRTDRQTPA
jgi:hypothetical protein